jgi:hypothetical protein
MGYDPEREKPQDSPPGKPPDGPLCSGRRKAHEALTEAAADADALAALVAGLKPNDPWPHDEALALLSRVIYGVEPAVLWHRYESGQLPYGADEFPFFPALQAGLREVLHGAGNLVTAVGALERLQTAGRYEMSETDRTHLLAGVTHAGTRLLAEAERAARLLSSAAESASQKAAPPLPPSAN